MENSEFSGIIRKALVGDRDALARVIERYMPLINNRSVIDGKIDEDLRQCIILRVIEKLPGFNPRE
jgi:hypothetical protein